MKNISEKVPLPTFLFMMLVLTISVYSLHAKDHPGETTEIQDYNLTDKVDRKESSQALAEMESAQAAVVEPQRGEVFWVEKPLNEKEPDQEKENESILTAKASEVKNKKEEMNEEEHKHKETKDQEKYKEESKLEKTDPHTNENMEIIETVAFNKEPVNQTVNQYIEPASQYIEPVSQYIEPVSQVNADVALNKYVLDVINTYALGGNKYPYLLNNDYANYNGVTQTLTYQGQTLLRAHPSGSKASHCVGITFEVLFRAMQQRNRELGISVDNFNNMNYDQLFDFVMNWFAASGAKRNSNIAIAVQRYGIGERLFNLEDVKPGDFIDLNRKNGTGHTVVFINWIREGNRIIGLTYWSSQPSTGGINYNEEYFGNVLIDQMYMVRILPVSQYQS